jgi:hypothetical protein
MSHTQAREWLTPLADGGLSMDMRGQVEGHVTACTECSQELAELRRLNLVFASFPPAQPVAFASYWQRLRANLPAPRAARRPFFALPRRAALAFAMAALAALMIGGTAFASESALPDNPLYPVKRAGEQVLLTFALDQKSRIDLQITLASERLREAQAMAAERKGQLAAASLRDFNALLRLSASTLRQPGSDRTVKQLQSQLAAVRQVNSENGDNEDVNAQLTEGQNALDEDGEHATGNTESDSTSIVVDQGTVSGTDSLPANGSSASRDSQANETDSRANDRSEAISRHQDN